MLYPFASFTVMTVLRLDVNTGYSFLVRRQQRYALEIVEVGDLIAAKLHSPLVFCPKCPEGHHLQETICFSPQAADSTTLATMVQLLEGRIIDPIHFPFLDVCAMAQYLLITEDYFTPYLLCICALLHAVTKRQTIKNTHRLLLGLTDSRIIFMKFRYQQ